MKSPYDRVLLLLFGATGAVGQQVLRQALTDAHVVKVIAPTRRPRLPIQSSAIQSPVSRNFPTTTPGGLPMPSSAYSAPLLRSLDHRPPLPL